MQVQNSSLDQDSVAREHNGCAPRMSGVLPWLSHVLGQDWS